MTARAPIAAAAAALLLAAPPGSFGQCGRAGAGDCCVAHGTPFCLDQPCCATVCLADPFCCQSAWDAPCADAADVVCPGCPAGAAPINDDCGQADPVTAGRTRFSTLDATTDGPGHAQCRNDPCQGDAQVYKDVWFSYTPAAGGLVSISTCGAADFDARLAVYEGCDCGGLPSSLLACADGSPDCPDDGAVVTAVLAAGTCHLIRIGSAAGEVGTGTLTVTDLGPVACPGEGSCYVPNGTPGCDDADCCLAVCEIDPFCCDTDWDAICADDAAVHCRGATDCFCDFAEGSCCRANGTGGCEQPACCRSVCDVDPFCCDVAWDGDCADLAAHFCTSVCPPAAGQPADLDGDGTVGVVDLLILLGAWGRCPPSPELCPADLDGNGQVGVTDLLMLLGAWQA